jgi:CHAT domain-containing protein
LGEDARSLACFDRARELYVQLGKEREPLLSWIDQDRAIALRNLGRFKESIEANQAAWKLMSESGQTVEAARPQQALAITYIVLGRYNEALVHLDQARDIFLADGRQPDAMEAELYITDCLLQLRRFSDVLGKCRQIRERFTELGTRFEVAQALLNEAVAYAGLHCTREAIDSLAEARQLFIAEGSRLWIACTDLEMALLYLQQGQSEESLEISQACANTFQVQGLPVQEARAHLLAARAAFSLGCCDQARQSVKLTLDLTESRDIPSLTYQAYHLLGALAVEEGDLEQGLAEYDRAIREVERLRGRLMVEFRVGFVGDKQDIYEDMVDLCLQLDHPQQALEYAERAKSRALLDLLAYRLDLGLQAKAETDRALVDELVHLRAERDRLYRRWEGGEEPGEESRADPDQSRQRAYSAVLTLEKQITETWHQLLVRNADYARDASLWQVRTEPIQPYLEPDTALVEYFVCHGQLVAFVVTEEQIDAHRLAVDKDQVQRLIQLLWLNLRAVPQGTLKQAAHQAANAQGLLQRLHDLLVGPLSAVLHPYSKLIFVPHGSLHYLPFQALYDGTSFLLEQHEISYLPAASMLRYCLEADPVDAGILSLGHSYNGRLPYALQEAESIAKVLGDGVLLEERATMARLRAAASRCQIIHLATHGEFRPDNPLFSGLALADGWLTTLDIFDLRLNASLVTLSACHTGQSVVSEGDELMGLMRAFLSAGSASVILGLWTVEDRSAARLMEMFYRKLAEGSGKGAALRHAQLQFVAGKGSDEDAQKAYSHPYFWAPFFLVGDSGPL